MRNQQNQWNQYPNAYSKDNSSYAYMMDDGTRVMLTAGKDGVTEDWIAQLKAYVDLGLAMPSYDEIVADPQGCRAPDTVDGQMIACYELAARGKEEHFAELSEYIDRLGGEFQIAFIKRPTVPRWHRLPCG